MSKSSPVPLEDGCITREQVIQVLSIAAEHGNYTIDIRDGISIALFKEGNPEVYDLPPIVTRRMIARLSNKYTIQPEWFYHPHMLTSGSNTPN